MNDRLSRSSARWRASSGAHTAQVGDYRLLRLLGRGAMGEVWLAHHVDLPEAPVALKLLNEVQSSDEDGRRRFQREAEVLARIDRHPAIVRIHAAGFAPDGRPFYAMEYVAGQTLKQALREGLPRDQVLDALEQVADGLAFAHRHGIVHRDVKPENVLLTAEGGTRLTDFGLARLESTADRLTRTGEILGTPVYMAPEQVDRTRGEVGPASDVWAVGTVLYEVLCGNPPYAAATSLEVYTQLTERAPIAPPPARDPIERALGVVCLRALEHEPAARFASMDELLVALRAARGGELWDGAPAPRGGAPRLLLALAGGSLLLALAALVALRARPGATPTGAPGAPVAAPLPAAPADPAAPSRAARGPDLPAALARLRGRGDELARGLELLACAEAGRDPVAARAPAQAAGALLDGPRLDDPASEAARALARARAALLAGRAGEAQRAAARALETAPQDPGARHVAALARIAAWADEALRLELARLPGAEPDPAGEAALARSWAEVARELSAIRALVAGGEQEPALRLDAARAWSQAIGWSVRAAADPAALEANPGLAEARQAGLRELLPLLGAVPVERLRRARLALAPGGDAAHGEAAERELAACLEAIGPARATAREAARVALTLGGPEARGWAEVWLALAGDLPARAALLLERAAHEPDLALRRGWLARARRLDPDSRPLALEGLLLELESRQSSGGAPSTLWREATLLLEDAPELLPGLGAALRAGPPQALGATPEAEGQTRTALLARALAHLYGGPASEDPAQAAREAEAALGLDPGSALGWLLLAEAELRGDERSRRGALTALERAAAAAPAAGEPRLARLRWEPQDRWSDGDLLPALLRGHVFRVRELVPPLTLTPLPAATAVRGVVLGTKKDAQGNDVPPDLTRSDDRSGLLGLLALRTPELHLSALAPFPLAVRLTQQWLDDEEWPEVDARLRALLISLPDGPERAAAAARGLSRLQSADQTARRARLLEVARAGAQALAGFEPLGGLSRPAWRAPVGRWLYGGEHRTGPAALVAAGLPDYPALAWEWWVELRRPELIRLRGTEALHDLEALPRRAPLSSEDLLDPRGRSHALLLAVADEDAQRDLARALIRAGQPAEAQLATLRAVAAERQKELAGRLRSRIETLAQEHLWSARARPDERAAASAAIAGLLSGALELYADRPGERDTLRGARVDLLLWQAGGTSDPAARTRLLEQARAQLAEVDQAAAAEEGDDPPFWLAWRRARLHGALGERPAYVQALAEAQAELGQGGEALSSWRRSAVQLDPLLPLLQSLPGYEALLEAVQPRAKQGD